MLRKIYNMLAESTIHHIGITVAKPPASGNNTTEAIPVNEPLSRVPPLVDREDYEVRLYVDMVDQIIQPLNVYGLNESDNAKLLIYLMPPETGAEPEDKPEKVYEALAHDPLDPLPYRVGRQYLMCLKVDKGPAIGIVSVRIENQEVHTKEFAALPYWSMKWLDREQRQ